MRLVTFATHAEPRRSRVGAIGVGYVLELPYTSMRELLGAGEAGLTRTRAARRSRCRIPTTCGVTL